MSFGNQRVLLTMAAISVFGVTLAWLIPRSDPQAGGPIGLVTILLLFVLFILYLYSHLLGGMVRVLRCYLIVMECSWWERDCLSVALFFPITYTKSQTIVFMALGVFAFLFPFLLKVAYSLQCKPISGVMALVIVWIWYEVHIGWLGFHNHSTKEEDIKQKWESIKNRCEA